MRMITWNFNVGCELRRVVIDDGRFNIRLNMHNPINLSIYCDRTMDLI